MIDETAGAPRSDRSVASKRKDVSAKAPSAASATKRTNGAALRTREPAAVARPLVRRSKASPAARAFGVVGMSLGTHMALMGVLGFMPQPAEFFATQRVEMEVIEPEPPPPPPPPKVEEPPKPAEPEPPKAAPKPAPKPAEPEPPKPPEAAPAPEAPVDLTGVTLTGGDGASWSSVVGTGGALKGPAPRVAAKTGRDRAGTTGIVGGKGDKPVLVAEASLSRKPVPPEGMDALLEQNYPPRARAQGVSGSALLRVTILSDGRVGDIKVMRETGDYEFGARCQKTVRQRRWQPALDRRGQPVATEIRYSCEFEVAY